MSNMSSVTPRPRNARGQGAQLRDDLLDATLAGLAVTGDPEDVSIRGVAKTTGVSPTAVYQHFTDRDALIEAACDRAFDHFAAYLLAAVEPAVDAFDRLRLAGHAYLRYAVDEPGLYRVLFSNPLHLALHTDETKAVIPGTPGAPGTPGVSAFGVLVDMVQACLDAGAPASTSSGTAPDATYLSFQVWTWLHGIVDLRITHPAMPWPPAEPMVDDIARVLGLDSPRVAPR